ncbi:ORF6N domain-containing protein [Mucilaginibacter limnophilus]|uniref:ORF6N domain-containing protein n=1 Tax=Mucilaginibacter limnophilus TaxID=1932778 RepID=A0A437MXV5_9SPHI|nr:ORF6N domain-containing protein [Mucilaginibacter limnophilus]RVU02505.1 ORF6N domain-containing protein [Mucilaginibacter limnophilus]
MSGKDQQPLNQVHWLRGQRVMIDEDVASLFQVSLKLLRQRVSRNKQRFPPDFVFLPTLEEWQVLQQQADLSFKIGKGEIPMVFTEAGLLMASGIIKSDVAIKVSIQVINEFFEIVKRPNQ